MTELLHLRAEEAGDIPVLSALVQDMVVRIGDVGFDAKARRLLFLGNRFRHEVSQPSRARTLLRIDFVTAVKRRNWPEAKDRILPLLAINHMDEALLLRFGDGADLRVEVEALDVSLDDVAGPWDTDKRPDHT